MAYDEEANIAFDCPGHQGGQFYRKSPAGPAVLQALRRARLPQRPVQRRRGARRSADPRGRRRAGAASRGAGVRRRQDLLRAERHEHVQQGRHQRRAAARRSGALRPQQPQVAPPGRAGAGRRDPDLPADGAQPLRHDRRRRLGRLGRGRTLREQIRAQPARARIPSAHKAPRPFRLACIQLATYDGTIYNVRKVLEKIGHLCDYVLWDEAWIGYNAFHPLFEDHSPMRLGPLGPEMPGLFSTQSVHKQGAGFSQASQIHKRDEHIRGQRRYVEHKRFNESFLMNASTSPFYPLFASLDVNAKIHEGKAGEMLWDRCIELGIEARKKLREFVPLLRADRQERRGAVVLRSVRAGRRHDPRLAVHRGRRPTCPGRTCRPTSSSASSSAGTSTRQSTLARLRGLRRRLRDGRSQQAHAADAGHRSPDRRVPGFRRPGDGRRQLPARTARRAGEVRSQQHPLPDDAGRGREQAQHADREARQVQGSLGPRRAARRGAADAVRRAPRALRRLHAAANLQRDARFLPHGERQGAPAALFPRLELPRARDVAEGRLRGARRQRRRLRAARRASVAAFPRRSR